MLYPIKKAKISMAYIFTASSIERGGGIDKRESYKSRWFLYERYVLNLSKVAVAMTTVPGTVIATIDPSAASTTSPLKKTGKKGT